MNGESDQPPAVLIGTWAEDEDEPEAPPLQLPSTSGNARQTRQIPNARVLEGELDASNDMAFLGLTATPKLSGARVQSANSTLLHSAHPCPWASPAIVLALAPDAYNTPLKGGDHEKNTRSIAVFLVRSRLGPDRRRAAQRREEHRKPHYLRHGLR